MATHGSLACQVCGFDFGACYGELGDGFIEAHDRTPLAQAGAHETKTSVHDLALVCANCHRILHRRVGWLTVEELRRVVLDGQAPV